MQGRATRTDTHAPAQQPEAGIGIDADVDDVLCVGAGTLEQIEVLGRVDHDRDPRGSRGALDDLRQRTPIDAWVTDDDILDTVCSEPQRLGDGQRRTPAEGTEAVAQHPFKQAATAD